MEGEVGRKVRKKHFRRRHRDDKEAQEKMFHIIILYRNVDLIHTVPE